MPHPRMLAQLLSPGEIAEWHAYYTHQREQEERAARMAKRRRGR